MGFDDRPRAGRSRSGSRPHPDDVGDEWRIVSPSTRGNLSRDTSRNVGWGSPLGTGAVDLYPPVSFGVVDGFGIRRLYGARLLRGAIQGYVSEERWEWKAR